MGHFLSSSFLHRRVSLSEIRFGMAGRVMFLALAWLLAVSLPALAGSAVATTTTLAVASSGSAVTTVASGTVVTLTATVVAGTTPVTTGQVKFCDATAPHCEDIHIVGTAQLTSAGTAVFKFRPGVGSHSYKAVFVGTNSYLTSASTAAALTVSPPAKYPSIAKLTATTSVSGSGVGYNADLSAWVFGNGSTVPTGTVSFIDTSNNNAVVGTATFSGGTNGAFLGLANSSNFSTPGIQPEINPGVIAVGDFNGDGIPDLAVANSAGSTVTIMLGNGDATFTAAAISMGTSCVPWAVAVGDFNGDGIQDLSVLCYNGDLDVLLGNGDGTFRIESGPTTNEGNAIAVGDFNGDGIQDLAISSAGSDSLQVFLGNGDGTFTAAANSALGGSVSPLSITVADFNGDGIQDLAVAGSLPGGPASVAVLLGKGDGSLRRLRLVLTVEYERVLTGANRGGRLQWGWQPGPGGGICELRVRRSRVSGQRGRNLPALRLPCRGHGAC
jgi:hypothetical protein